MLEILYYIFIFPVEQVLEWALFTLFKATKNYGVSIILLSLIMQLFMLKLTFYFDKKAASFGALKAQCDSKIKEFKRVFKGAELQSYIRTLYKQKHFHPIFALFGLGGLALQIPFFIAMIHLVENAEYLQSVRFLWIDDLSKPDSIMLFGLSIHILPLLMTAFTLINVFYSSKELGARVQGSLIALLFLVLLYSMPSALVLYWTCNMFFSLLKEIFKHKKHSSLSNHSQDCVSLEAVITHKVTPAPKSTQNSQSNTAITRMRESADRVGVECRDSNDLNLSQDARIAESRMESKITSSKQNSKDTESKTSKSKLQVLVFNIFTPHATIDSKTYKTYRNISILAILNICFIICVFSPYAIYSSDVSQFDISQTYQTLGALFGFFVLSSFMLIYFISLFYKTRLLKIGVYGVSVILCVGLVYTFVLVGNYGAMDHFILHDTTSLYDSSMKLQRYFYFLFVLCGAVIFCLFMMRWLKQIWGILFVTLFVMSSYYFIGIAHSLQDYAKYSHTQNIQNSNDMQPYEKELFSYSKTEKNIVVMVLDMFSGSHMHPLLEQFPEFKTKLDGFVLFDNAISTTNATIHSIATIIGGEHYAVYNMNAREENIAHSFTEAFGVVGDTFVKNGYNVGYFMSDWILGKQDILAYNRDVFILQNPDEYRGLYVKTHPEFSTFLHYRMLHIWQLLGFGVFRFSPEAFIRGKVYDGGLWLINGLQDRAVLDTFQAINFDSSFYAFTHLHNTESKKPTFKYLHSLMTHEPYGGIYYQNERCIYGSANTIWNEYSGDHKMSFESAPDRTSYYGHYDSEVCSLQYLVDFIEWLKSEGIYNNTQLFIVSDHGGWDPIDLPERFVLQKSPDVLFLFKDFKAKGALRQDSTLMANYDIPSIFCENLPNGCPNVPRSILKRTPVFLQNRILITSVPKSAIFRHHKQNEWLIDYYFQIKGNIYDENSWQDITESVKNGTLKIDGIKH